MITSELVAENGRTFVVKRADPAADADAARLAREATMLAIARHPGVVEVAPGPDPPDPARAPVELRTVHAGARTLAAPDIDPLAALQALATTAETVADLHALGLVHGRLDPDHIVLTSSGRAVLCGFAEAGLAGDRRPDGTVLVPSVDVAALGARLAEALDRLREPTSGPRRAAVDRAGLARLVERAAAADAGLGPSARAVAAGLAAALPRPARPIVVTPAGHIEDGVARSARPGPAPMRSD
ncbi:MAG: hypothetical protein ACXWCB_18270, partial [Acidimicrobiales bacterium]